MIRCLGIIETKQNIYDYTIDKYKRKMNYIQKNNFNYCKLVFLVKNGQREFGGSCTKINF